MNRSVLLATIEYLSRKEVPDAEDLQNEKRAWDQLVELGIKKDSEVPERVKTVATKEGERVSDAKALGTTKRKATKATKTASS